jgi:hypothetical protein
MQVGSLLASLHIRPEALPSQLPHVHDPAVHEDDEVVLETVHGEDVIDKKVMNAHGGAVASRAASAPTTAPWHGVLLLVAVPQEGGEAGGLFGSLGGGLQETLEPTDDL